MSEIVSAVGAAGFEAPNVSIKEQGAVGMITIRGDFDDEAFRSAVEAASGAAFPAQHRFEETPTGGLGWMSPDELLWVLPYADAPGAVADLTANLGDAHSLVVNVSDARAVFTLSGRQARELVAKGAPVDMSPAGFAPGEFRRSHIGQVAAAFWMSADDRRLTVVCFRSLGAYLYDWFVASSRDGVSPGMY